MADHNLHNIKELVQEMMKNTGIQHKVYEEYIKANWEEIAGKTIAKYTHEVKLVNSILHITVLAAPLRQELFYNREKLITLVNEALKAPVVKELALK